MDRRETILSRVYTIIQTYSGIKPFRNRTEFSAEFRPAIALLDGSETSNPSAHHRGRVISPVMVTMRPDIILVLANAKPSNENVGSTVNALRLRLIADIFGDTVLQEAVGPNGEIRFEGCETDLAKGRELIGELTMNFAFVYPLIPSEI